ncbi:MAG: hypothetical protein ACLR1N_02275 [Bifidobacterium pseudocatenulatum]
MVLIVILMFTLCADLYVTASGIIKMNRRLERMEKIAGELHEISRPVRRRDLQRCDRGIGETGRIQKESGRVQKEDGRSCTDSGGCTPRRRRLLQQNWEITLKEKIERIRTEGSQVTEEMIARIAGLKQKYREAGKLELFSNRRLLKAFPETGVA